jgi:hypothetical protein
MDRNDFQKVHPATAEMEHQHPDERAIPCPDELLELSEWDTRSGDGYVLKDGAYYDPITGAFFGVMTI